VEFWVFGFTTHFGPDADPIRTVDFAAVFKVLFALLNPRQLADHGNWLSKQRESKIQPYDFYNQSSNSCPNHFRELMVYFQFPSLPSTMLLFCEIKS
jgi:hypothetical protein